MDPTLFDQLDSSGARSARVTAWSRIAAIDPASARWESELSAVAMVLVDAVLAADVEALEAVADPLRNRIAALSVEAREELEMRGWLRGLLAVSRWTLQRLPSSEELKLRRSSLGVAFLSALTDAPRTSAELQEELKTGGTQVSRVANKLLSWGIVVRRPAGKQVVWDLTPRGEHFARGLANADPHLLRTRKSPQRALTRSKPAARTSVRRKHSAAYFVSQSRPSTNGPRTAAKRDVRDSERQLRSVLPIDGGGWKVVVGFDGRQVAAERRKSDAVRRAKQILANRGGGRLALHDRSGGLLEILEVARRQAN